VRAVAALPAAGLISGAAVGLFVAEVPRLSVYALLIGVGALAWLAWRAGDARLLAIAVVAAFSAGGTLLSADAWQRAWRPSLWTAFEALARAQRQEAEAVGRWLPLDEEAFAIVRGRLRADASLTPSGVSLSLNVEGMEGLDGREGQEGREGQDGPVRSAALLGPRITGGIIVTVVGSLAAERLDQWRAGRRVRMPVQLHRPSRYLNPGVPDQERALARRGIRLVGSVKSGALIDVMERGRVLDETMSAARTFARRAIAAAVGPWDAHSAAIVAAIVIGDRAGLTEDVQRRLQEAGTYHVIAISGGNIAILAGLLLAMFRVAGWFGRTAMVSAIAVLLAYARLVGDSASVDRATLMAVVYFAARAVDQRSPPLNALAVVAAVLVVADPLSVADPAFILTFGATLAILVVLPVASTAHHEGAKRHEAHEAICEKTFLLPLRVASWLREKPWIASGGRHVLQSLAMMFAASAAAEALLFPASAAIFSRVTFAGLGLNLLAIPMMAVTQVAGMVVVPLSALSTGGALAAGWVAHVGAAGLVRSAGLVDYVPMLTYRLAPPSWTAVATYYVAAAVGWTLWRRRAAVSGSAESRPIRTARLAATVIALSAALWILIDPATLAAGRGDGRLHITFLDVGQGDSIFVAFPHGRSMLVDTGGLSSSSSFDIGERIVAPVLRAAGIPRLDYLVLTHGDPDHIGGAPSIVREFKPREVWEGIPVPRFEPLTALRLAVQAGGARWSNVYAGDAIEIDGVQVRARHPMAADWERQKVRNDDSLVLELQWRDVSILLTGDIGKTSELSIAPALSPARLRIVKVPHHGSFTSSTWEFLRAARPQIAVVSAGRSNHFGHPVPEVLERYRAVGAEMFRTDRDGAVMVDSDGYSIDVHTFADRGWSPR
jgi:competence protein ComEC